MYRWVNETLRRCETCQVKKGSIPNQRGLLVSHVTGYPFQKISIDFVGPLPRLKKGNEYMLTVSDCFTRWLEAFPCRQANAQVVDDKLITEIFPPFGVCDQIHSDRGTQFLSDLISEVVAALCIRQSSTPSYNPKSNPVERQHRLLCNAIKALTEGDQRAWEDYLPHALFAMRSSICVSTGFAPFAAMFGRNASASLEMVFGSNHKAGSKNFPILLPPPHNLSCSDPPRSNKYLGCLFISVIPLKINYTYVYRIIIEFSSQCTSFHHCIFRLLSSHFDLSQSIALWPGGLKR
jgi:hypothetical protein